MAELVEHDFPIFPLGIVALPHELVPLHIFEARYRVMLEECLETEREFGIVWSADEGLQNVGCAVEIADVVEQLDDGRVNIVTRGTRPFLLHERSESFGYPTGTIEWLSDEPEEPDDDVRFGAQTAYRDLVEAATDRNLSAEDVSEMGAYRMAATVEFGPGPKQILLGLRSENDRLHLLTDMFREALERLEIIGRSEARARSNGRVVFE